LATGLEVAVGVSSGCGLWQRRNKPEKIAR